MSVIKEIVLVGHCGFDSQILRNFATEASNGLPTHNCISQEELDTFCREDCLLLINRELGGNFKESLGVDLARKLVDGPCPPRVILISNYSEAQQLAEANGAYPGFGKSELNTEHAHDCLKNAIG